MSAGDSIPAEKMDTASGSSLVLPISSPASSARSCDLEGSSDSSSQSISPTTGYLLITAFPSASVQV